MPYLQDCRLYVNSHFHIVFISFLQNFHELNVACRSCSSARVGYAKASGGLSFLFGMKTVRLAIHHAEMTICPCLLCIQIDTFLTGISGLQKVDIFCKLNIGRGG